MTGCKVPLHMCPKAQPGSQGSFWYQVFLYGLSGIRRGGYRKGWEGEAGRSKSKSKSKPCCWGLAAPQKQRARQAHQRA